MANNSQIRTGRTISRENAIEWALGWNGGLARAPFREITSGLMNYDLGRLYAVEALAAGLPVKPWVIRSGKSKKVKFPDWLPDNRAIGCNPIPPRYNG